MAKEYTFRISGTATFCRTIDSITVIAETDKEAIDKAIDVFCDCIREEYDYDGLDIDDCHCTEVRELEPRWIVYNDGTRCSICGKQAHSLFTFPYCPHCGSKMTGESVYKNCASWEEG